MLIWYGAGYRFHSAETQESFAASMPIPPKSAEYGYDAGFGTYESPEPAASLGLKTVPWGKDREPQHVARHDRTRWMVDQTLAFAREQTRAKPLFGEYGRKPALGGGNASRVSDL